MMQIFQRLDKRCEDFEKELDPEEIVESFITNNANHLEFLANSIQSSGYCENQVEEGDLAFQCFTCSKNPDHIICGECFDPNLHIGHKCFPLVSQGFCDCGDEEIIKGGPCNHSEQQNQEINNIPQINQNIPADLQQSIISFIQASIQLYKKLKDKFYQQPQNHHPIILRLYNLSIQRNITKLKKLIDQKSNIASYYFLSNKIKNLFNILVTILDWLTENRFVFQQFLEIQFQKPYVSGQNNTLYEDFIEFCAMITDLQDENLEQDTILQRLSNLNFKKFAIQKCLNKYQQFWYFKQLPYCQNNNQFIVVLDEIDGFLNLDKQQSIKGDDPTFNGLLKLTEEFWKQSKTYQFQLYIQSNEMSMLMIYGQSEIMLEEFILNCDNSNIFKIIKNLYLQLHTPNLIITNTPFNAFELCIKMFKMEKFDHYSVMQLKEALGNQFENFQNGKVSNKTLKNFQMNDFIITILIKCLSEANPITINSFKDNFDLLQDEKEDIINYINFQANSLQTINIGIQQIFKSEKCTNSFKMNFINLLLVKCYNFIKLKRNLLQSIDLDILIAAQKYFNNPQYQTQEVYEFRKIFIHLIKNAAFLDKVFINLLFLHYCQMEYVNSGDFRKFLEDLFEDSIDIIRQNFIKIIQRCVQNYCTIFYTLDQKIFDEYYGMMSEQNEQIKLESIDTAFGKLYLFLFDQFGLQDIIKAFQTVSLPFQRNNLELSYSYFLRIVSSDLDIFNLCIDFYHFEPELPKVLQQTLNKIISNFMNLQNFLQYSTIERRLKMLGAMTPSNLKYHVTKICQIDQTIKKLKLLPQYQKVFDAPMFSYGSETKNILIQRLQDKQKKQKIQIFGDGLEWDLTQFHIEDFQPMRKLALFILSNIQQIYTNISLYLQNNIQNEDILTLLYYQLVSASYFRAQEININAQKILGLLMQIQKTRYVKEYQKIYEELIFMVKTSTYRTEFQQNITQIIYKDHKNKKQKVQQKFQSKITNFQQKWNVEPTKNRICDYCLTEIDDDEVIPAFFDFRKQSKIFQFIPDDFHFRQDAENSIYVSLDSCDHKYHKQCFEKAEKQFYDSQPEEFPEWYKKACPICKSSFNIVIHIKKNVSDDDVLRFNQNLQNTIIAKVMEQQLNEFHQNNQESILLELYYLIILDLIAQLLNDQSKFLLKNKQQVLKQIIKQLKVFGQIIKKNNIQIDYQIEQKESIIFQLLNATHQFIIKDSNLDKFNDKIKQVLIQFTKFNPILLQILRDCFEFTISQQQQIENEIQQTILKQDQLINYFSNLKLSFLQAFIDSVGQNFLQFHSKYFHQGCSVCGFYNQNFGQSLDFHYCLLCQQNFCQNCCNQQDEENEEDVDGENQENDKIGNLNQHALEQHFGGSVFISLLTGTITLVQYPFALYQIQQLFYHQNLGHYLQIQNKEENWEDFLIDESQIKNIINLLLDNNFYSGIALAQTREQQLFWRGEL